MSTQATASTPPRSFFFDRLVPFLILASIVAVGTTSVWPGEELLVQISEGIYGLSFGVFVIEYGLRVWRAPEASGSQSPIKARLRTMLSVMMLIDLLALISVPAFGLLNNAFFIRVFRLFAIADNFGKSKAYSPSKLFINTFTKFKEELLITVAVIFLGIIFVTYAIYFVEQHAQPEKFGDIRPSFLWAMTMVVGGEFSTLTPVTDLGQILRIIAVIFSIGIVAAPIGIIGGGFVDQIAEVKQSLETSNHHQLLVDGFGQHAKIQERKLMVDLGLNARRKFMTLDYINTRLELTSNEVFSAARALPGLRIRAVKRTQDSPYEDMMVVEHFTDNTPYGALKPGKRNIVLISTQNTGDVFSGHWTETLADALDATYIANQHFSSGAPLSKHRINFSKNDAYLADSDETPPEVLKTWMDDLKAHIEPDTLVINVGTAGENREDFMLLFGGQRGQADFAVEETTYTDLKTLETFYHSLKTTLREKHDYGCITHETFGNTAAANLSTFIRRETGANVISPRISVKVLRYAAATDYYGAVHAFKTAILEHLDPTPETASS